MTTRAADSHAEDRLLELLADEATQGLAPEELRELEDLLAEHDAPSLGRDDLALAAAAADRAFAARVGEVEEPLPAALRERILASAPTGGAATAGSRPTLTPVPPPAGARPVTSGPHVSEPAGPHDPAPPPGPGSGFLGWLVAVAASVLALLGWIDDDAPNPRPLTQPQLVEARKLFLNGTPDAVRADWAATGDAGEAFAGVTGDVAWSVDQQTGYMRLAGLPVNDPDEQQYQLWIVDPTRDDEPVDGGVFDVTRDGELVVAIDAKLEVDSPRVFALTLEQPGGVVVSENPLLVVASVEG